MALAAFRIGPAIAPRLPHRALRVLAWLGGAVGAAFPTATNARHRRNLGRVMALPPDSGSVRAAARAAVQSQALNYLELFSAPGLTAEAVRRSVDVDGAARIEAALQRGRGAVMASAHVGSLDRLGVLLPALGYRASAIVEPLRPPELLERVVALRGALGGILIPLDRSAMARAGSELMNGGLVGVAADWDADGTGIAAPFCGHTIRVPVGPALLAIRNGVPILPIWCVRVPGGRFAVTVEQEVPISEAGSLRERVRATTLALTERVEAIVRRHPQQWAMFHDVWVSADTMPPATLEDATHGNQR